MKNDDFADDNNMEYKEDAEYDIVIIAVRVLVVVLFLCFLGFCGYFLFLHDKMENTTPTTQNALEIEISASEEPSAELSETYEVEIKQPSDSYEAEMELLRTYMEYNEDVVGMIRIKDSVLYHPIMRSEYQEDYYLNRDLDKKYNSHGVPFVSLGSKLDEEGNSVIYGHNITLNTRDVFCDLAYYSDLDYYKEHPIVEIITENGVSKYLIFAYYLVDLSDADAFFYSETTNFLSMKKYNDYMHNVRVRNFLDVPCDLSFDDCYITLSSCSNELHGLGTNRMVVMAKKLDEGEEYQEYVDNAGLNPYPLMPMKLR